MHQGDERDEARNFEAFAFDPHALAFVLLTHAHIDHSGLLPRLVAEGFGGPIYATAGHGRPGRDHAARFAHIQEMEAEWSQRRARRAGRRAPQALYTSDQVRRRPGLRAVEYGEMFHPGQA